MKIINAQSNTFSIDRFTAHSGDAWYIVGSNRSGIEDFFQLVSGQDTEVTADQLELPENMGVVSFKNQQDLYESELRKDCSTGSVLLTVAYWLHKTNWKMC